MSTLALRLAATIFLSMICGCSWEPMLQFPDAQPTSKTIQSIALTSGERLEIVRHEETKQYSTIGDHFNKIRATGLDVRMHANASDPVGKTVYEMKLTGDWRMELGDDPLARQSFNRSHLAPTAKIVQVDKKNYLFTYDLTRCRALLYSPADEKFIETDVAGLDRRVLDAAYAFDPNDDPSWHFCLLDQAEFFGRKKTDAATTAAK